MDFLLDDDKLALTHIFTYYAHPFLHTSFLPFHPSSQGCYLMIFMESTFSDSMIMIRKMLVRAELCSVPGFTFLPPVKLLFFFTTGVNIASPLPPLNNLTSNISVLLPPSGLAAEFPHWDFPLASCWVDSPIFSLLVHSLVLGRNMF